MGEIMNSFFSKIKNFFILLGTKLKSFFIKIRNKLSGKQKQSNQNAETQSQSEDFSQKNSQSSQNAEYTEFSIPNSESISENQTKTVNVEKISKKICSFFLNFFDTLFEIAFFCGIFFILRPDFFNNSEYIWTASFNFEFLKSFTFLGINQIFIPHSEISLSVISIIFLIYFLYKFIFSLAHSKGMNKLVSILLVLMEFVFLFLLKDKFLIFLILYILLFFAFQFSSEINFKISRTKLILIFIFSLIAYFVLLSCFDKTFQFLNSALLKEIHLPIKWF